MSAQLPAAGLRHVVKSRHADQSVIIGGAAQLDSPSVMGGHCDGATAAVHQPLTAFLRQSLLNNDPMKPSQRPLRLATGFTLIEIMVVVVIIGLLSALVVPAVIERTGDARVTKAKNDVRSIGNALQLYKLDNFNYPSTQQGLQALVIQPQGEPPARNWQKGGYIEKLPNDPWGNPYQYLYPGTRGEYDLYSLGADGRPGGEADAADIGNWAAESS